MKELKFISSENKDSSLPVNQGDSCCPSHKRGTVNLQIKKQGAAICCSHKSTNVPEWIDGTVATSAGIVYRVLTHWTRSDYWGQIRSRMSAFRMNYTVQPGLYAVGNPDKDSDILVSANYKLSFDMLRRSLKELNAWILVLDTKGINVWCAAGKGTFGTEELIKRIRQAQLNKVVDNKRIILPQLGAPGIHAHIVKKATGFKVYFGPVSASDIPAYLEAGYKATEDMRSIKFTVLDRLVLTPMEINPAMKKFPLYALIVLILFGLQPSGIVFTEAWNGGLPFILLGLLSIFAGAFITPVFLPFVPFRSFALKGLIVGIITVFMALNLIEIFEQTSRILLLAVYLFFPLAASYIALQFTGSTTYTSMSGVKKELKFALPVYISSVIVSLLLLIAYKLVEWEVV